MKTLAIAMNVVHAVVVAGGLMVAHGASASPDDGVKCPSGFSSSFNGTSLTCKKQSVSHIDNASRTACPQDPSFSVFQRMSGNKDICVNAAVNIPSDANLSNFENGQIVITFPRGVQIPNLLQSRVTTTVTTGARTVRLNPNADFIFFEASTTAKNIARTTAAAVEVATRIGQSLPADSVESKVASIAAEVDAAGGSLDKVKVNVDTFTLAK
jgi:hypothetical protein